MTEVKLFLEYYDGFKYSLNAVAIWFGFVSLGPCTHTGWGFGGGVGVCPCNIVRFFCFVLNKVNMGQL